jgi:hypothetical protein
MKNGVLKFVTRPTWALVRGLYPAMVEMAGVFFLVGMLGLFSGVKAR